MFDLYQQFLSLLLFLASLALSQSTTSDKRGLVYISTSHESDYSLLTSSNSDLTWYYNWAPSPSLRSQDNIAFVPLIHGISNLNSDVRAVKRQSDATHLLTFNEPDGSTDTGGSGISPSDAAEAYINFILPLRSNPHNLLISLPATTGSPRGLTWLRDFNTSCFRLNPGEGCPADFLGAHWYGSFAAMASWLGTLHVIYPDLPIWLTEFALPQADEDATVQFLNQSMRFLDELEYVERYSWFGSLRRSDAGGFVGENVALLDDSGGLTQLAVEYLGGAAKGFEVGMKGSEGGTTGSDGGTTGSDGGTTGSDGGTKGSAATIHGNRRLLVMFVLCVAGLIA